MKLRPQAGPPLEKILQARKKDGKRETAATASGSSCNERPRGPKPLALSGSDAAGSGAKAELNRKARGQAAKAKACPGGLRSRPPRTPVWNHQIWEPTAGLMRCPGGALAAKRLRWHPNQEEPKRKIFSPPTILKGHLMQSRGFPICRATTARLGWTADFTKVIVAGPASATSPPPMLSPRTHAGAHRRQRWCTAGCAMTMDAGLLEARNHVNACAGTGQIERLHRHRPTLPHGQPHRLSGGRLPRDLRCQNPHARQAQKARRDQGIYAPAQGNRGAG